MNLHSHVSFVYLIQKEVFDRTVICERIWLIKSVCNVTDSRIPNSSAKLQHNVEYQATEHDCITLYKFRSDK